MYHRPENDFDREFNTMSRFIRGFFIFVCIMMVAMFGFYIWAGANLFDIAREVIK